MDEIKISQLQPDEKTSGLQFFESRVQAGFPSPAQGEYADGIDLNRALITNPAATFCARVIGERGSPPLPIGCQAQRQNTAKRQQRRTSQRKRRPIA